MPSVSMANMRMLRTTSQASSHRTPLRRSAAARRCSAGHSHGPHEFCAIELRNRPRPDEKVITIANTLLATVRDPEPMAFERKLHDMRGPCKGEDPHPRQDLARASAPRVQIADVPITKRV